jgi:hypothetical protein
VEQAGEFLGEGSGAFAELGDGLGTDAREAGGTRIDSA